MTDILLLGGSGFLGRHLLDAWLEEGREIWVPSRHPASPDLTQHRHPRLHVFPLNTFRPSTFFVEHPSANIIVNALGCYGREGETLDSLIAANLTLPLSVLEACASTSRARLFINAATALPPNLSAYALSKAHFSAWGEYFSTAGRGVIFVNARLQHFYGPGAPPSNFITHLVRACINGETSIALTDGMQQRDFIYIDDVVRAFVALARATIPHSYFCVDIGSGKAISIRSIAEMIRDMSSSKILMRFGAIPMRPNEPTRCVATLDAIARLGWLPTTSIHDGLWHTIEGEKRR